MHITPKMRQTKTRIQHWLLLALSAASLLTFFLMPTEAFARSNQPSCHPGYYYNISSLGES